MREHRYTATTALALLFGLGVVATGTPAGVRQSMAREICGRNEDGFIDAVPGAGPAAARHRYAGLV